MSWHICPRRFTNIRADSHLGFVKWLIVKLLFRYILSKDCALNNIQHISYFSYMSVCCSVIPKHPDHIYASNEYTNSSSAFVYHFTDFVMLCLRCVVHVHLLLDMVQTGTMYWLSSVLPYVFLFIIPLVPKLLYRSTRIISLSLVPKLLYRSIRIISLSVIEWLYNIDGGIETLRSHWH